MSVWRLRIVGSVLVLLVAGLVVAWSLGPVLSDLAQARQDEALVRRYDALVAQGPRMGQAATQLRDELADGDRLFADSSPELASADLQTSLQGLISASGGQIESSQIGTPLVVHGLEQLTVSLDISLPGDRLPGLLRDIVTHKPYLFVQGLDIRASDSFGSGRMLDVDMQISGFSDVE